MQILFDEQDLKDALCVDAALDEAGGYLSEAVPQDVQATISYDRHRGFTGFAVQYGRRTNYECDDDIINAIARYLHAYHSFERIQLAINLNCSDNRELSAQIVVLR